MDKYKITIETYNRLAKQYQDKFMDFDLYNDTYDLFCRLVEKENASILEIGCGPGNVTKYLLNKRPDFKILGIDVAPNMVTLAKQNNPSAQYKVMDCRKINQIKEKYDAIMCGFCLPYISKEEVAKLISDCSRLLMPEGIFYLSTMEGDYNKSGFKSSSSNEGQVYIYFHQAALLTNSLKDNGFNIIELRRQDYPEQDGTITTDLFIIAKWDSCAT